MQTTDISQISPTTIAMLANIVSKAAKSSRNALPTGTHEIEEILTLQLTGSVTVGEDSTRAPTCSIPLLPVCALLLKRMGCQRDAAMELLREVMTAALEMGEDARTQLLAETGVAEAEESLQKDVIAKLKRSPVKGQVTVKGDIFAVGIPGPRAKDE